MAILNKEIKELNGMKKYPSSMSYKGDLGLLDRPKVSIVGTRRPSMYTKNHTMQLAKALSDRGVVIVSGAAMGVDALSHIGAGAANTIAVLPSGINVRYPAVNQGLIKSIEENGLTLSQFDDTFRATAWSFVLRNEIVVSLGDILIVTEADLDSGSMRSVEYALKMDKKIFVLAHQINQSMGTNSLLQKGLATPIYDIEEFASIYGVSPQSDIIKDDFYYFCQGSPTLDEAIVKYADRVYEAELEGIIAIENGILRLV